MKCQIEVVKGVLNKQDMKLKDLQRDISLLNNVSKITHPPMLVIMFLSMLLCYGPSSNECVVKYLFYVLLRNFLVCVCNFCIIF